MIRLAISQAAFEAITSTLPVGFVAFDPEPNEKGERLCPGVTRSAVISKVHRLRLPGRPTLSSLAPPPSGRDEKARSNETLL